MRIEVLEMSYDLLIFKRFWFKLGLRFVCFWLLLVCVYGNISISLAFLFLTSSDHSEIYVFIMLVLVPKSEKMSKCITLFYLFLNL